MSSPVTKTPKPGNRRQQPPPPRNQRFDGVRAPAERGGGSTSLGAAIRRYPLLVALPTVLLLAAGILAGAAKSPTYSAAATINVGKSDINTQATPGYVQAAQALASTYSRLVMSQHISIPVAQQLHQSPATVAGGITAIPIPTQPTFTITATAGSPQGAVNLAHAAVTALQAYVNRSATQQGGAPQLLSRYQAAQAKADQLQLKASKIEARFRLNRPGVTSAQVQSAKVAGQVAALKAQALSGSYLGLSQNGGAPTLDVLIDPTSASSSNRKSNIEKYAVIGAVAGLAIGIAFAVLISALGTRSLARRTSA
jgi:capsular polysaccharide biosynthesis protein